MESIPGNIPRLERLIAAFRRRIAQEKRQSRKGVKPRVSAEDAQLMMRIVEILEKHKQLLEERDQAQHR
jgi:hypothetical protein